MRTPRFIQIHVADSIDERDSARAALLAASASASPKFFYDRLGSHLVRSDHRLPSTTDAHRRQRRFERCAAELARLTGSGITLIDLGAGNCAKATRLFRC
jgi:uncharacterized SAM-dependent methyltransferase